MKKRNLAWVLVSFGLRLAAGMLVMVLMARVFGRAEFGRFAYWLAVATLLSVPVNFGLVTFTLREIGASPARYHPLMSAGLTAKAAVTACLAVAVVAWASTLPAVDAAVLVLLFVAQSADSFTDFFNVGFRQASAFQQEAMASVGTSALHLVLMCAVVLGTGRVELAALAFALSRLTGMLLVRRMTAREAGPIALAPWAAVGPLLRQAWPYGGEIALLTGFSQLDSVMVGLLLGNAGVGLYQAGMKLVEGALRLAPVAAQYVLPTLSRHATAESGFARVARHVVLGFGAVGLTGAALLALPAQAITHYLYGDAYSALAPLLPTFGVMLFCRFLETACGLLVVARGLQHLKVWLVAVQLATMLGLGWWAMTRYGLPGWQWSAVGALALVLALYAVLLALAGRRNTASA